MEYVSIGVLSGSRNSEATRRFVYQVWISTSRTDEYAEDQKDFRGRMAEAYKAAVTDDVLNDLPEGEDVSRGDSNYWKASHVAARLNGLSRSLNSTVGDIILVKFSCSSVS